MVEKTKVQKVSRISPVWIVPVVAFVIAVWLAVQARLEKGEEIEIIFSSASDIVPGQTQIRLKDVQVGKVTAVRLSADLKEVVVRAEIDRNVGKHLSENTRFWVVTPRISASGVSNLGTLISGVFIVMDPGEPGASEDEFRGLDESPILSSDEEGTHYILQSETLGSLDVGSPIYYRQIKVGEVTGYKLADSQQHVDVNFFVRAPHDQMVTRRSRFWDVSGFGVSLGAEGVKAKMASVTSLLAGGIEFDNSASFGANTVAEEGHRFYLYPDRDSVLEERYTVKHHYLLRFTGSVKGLTVGAPVEFKGIKVGEVVDVELSTPENVEKSLKVYIAIQPQRFEAAAPTSREDVDALLESLVTQGLKAQMATSSLITGAKYIELAFMSETAGELARFDDFSELPTADDSAAQLTQKLDNVLQQVAAVPIQQIGEDLGASMASLRSILETLEKENTAGKIDGAMEGLDETLAAASEAIGQSEELLQNLSDLVAPDSEVKHGLGDMLDSLSEAGKSLQLFLDELNRHPNSLIGGAEKDE
jgi:paraquat-inducible protein B